MAENNPSCPHCGIRTDAHDHLAGDRPEEGPQAGAISLCLYCGGLGMFAEGGAINKIDDDIIDHVLADEGIARAVVGRALMAARGEVPIRCAQCGGRDA